MVRKKPAAKKKPAPRKKATAAKKPVVKKDTRKKLPWSTIRTVLMSTLMMLEKGQFGTYNGSTEELVLDLSGLIEAGTGIKSAWLWPFKSEEMVRRMKGLRVGRVGNVGHVEIIDVAVADADCGDGAYEWFNPVFRRVQA